MALENYRAKCQTFTRKGIHYDVRFMTDTIAAQLLADGCSLVERIPDPPNPKSVKAT